MKVYEWSWYSEYEFQVSILSLSLLILSISIACCSSVSAHFPETSTAEHADKYWKIFTGYIDKYIYINALCTTSVKQHTTIKKIKE